MKEKLKKFWSWLGRPSSFSMILMGLWSFVLVVNMVHWTRTSWIWVITGTGMTVYNGYMARRQLRQEAALAADEAKLREKLNHMQEFYRNYKRGQH